jgi:predicted RecB family nuclease
MKADTQLFEAYLKCPTKCWLRSRGESGQGNAYAEWAKERNETYCAQAVQRLRDCVPEAECVVAPPMENLKTAKWRLAVDVVAQASSPAGLGSVQLPKPVPGATPSDGIGSDGTFAPQTRSDAWSLESRLHAVERLASQGRGKPAGFIPIHFIFTNKLTRDDRLLVAFDAIVLSPIAGHEVSVGKIIHGEDHRTLKVKVAPLLSRARKLATSFTELLAGKTPPDIVLNRYCSECEFRDGCRTQAIAKDDLSLLANMTQKERRAFRDQGIFTVLQLSYTFRPRRRPRLLRDKPEKYHHALKALAIREKQIHIVGDVGLKVQGTPVYLDVEGLPDREFYYLIGLRIGNGGTAVQHSLWADTIADEGRIWREFLYVLKSIETPLMIHYGSFERTFLARMRQRYGELDSASETEGVRSPTLNLLSVIFGRIYFPTYSNGLKDVARSLGFNWAESEGTGLQTICWRHDWERTKAKVLKQRLIVYNADDCAALAHLHHVISRTAEGEGGNAKQVTSVQDLAQSNSMWPTFASPIPAFEAINKAGRWNYQRDHVYVRTDKVVRRATQASDVLPTRLLHPVKEVVGNASSICPVCGKKGAKTHKNARTLYDLRFGRLSVRTWVVRYHYPLYYCPPCHMTFGTPEEFRKGSMYGRNILGTVMYMLIELNMTQRAIAIGLNRMFKLGIQQHEVYHLKGWAARFYDQTRRQTLERMTKGVLLHADETSIIIKNKRCYVWVFATFHEVVYFYAETREAGFLQEKLKYFKGVLISDFYAAYDSIPCPQQKCLIHLMRDLNDAVLEHPFDEELKTLVLGFADLLRRIVDTVERRGLKRHFLKGYRHDVERFYRTMSKATNQSEAAVRCRERFEKNREKLFTFLDYDGVPWNNNNAEHAIKAFARLRREMAPEVGLEPTTPRLTAACSTIELLWNGVPLLVDLAAMRSAVARLNRNPG